MVDPFAISWLARGFKGNSVTFALLFATFVVGLSLSHGVKVVLARLGVHWLFILILPVVLFSWLAKREEQWLPDVAQRRRWARGLIAGSLALAVLIAWLKPEPSSEPARQEQRAR